MYVCMYGCTCACLYARDVRLFNDPDRSWCQLINCLFKPHLARFILMYKSVRVRVRASVRETGLTCNYRYVQLYMKMYVSATLIYLIFFLLEFMLFLDNPNKYKYISIHMQIGTWVQIDIHTDTKVGIYVIGGEGGRGHITRALPNECTRESVKRILFYNIFSQSSYYRICRQTLCM